MDVLMVTGIGETLRAGELLLKGAIDIGEKLLEDGGKEAITEFFQKSLGDAGERSGVTQFGRDLLKKLEDKGVAIVDDVDAQRYLKGQNALASTWFNGVVEDAGPHTTTVLLGENVNDAAIYEEYLHVLNGEERSWLGNGLSEAWQEEIKVETQVLSKADELGMTQVEREELQQTINSYRESLYNTFGITIP